MESLDLREKPELLSERAFEKAVNLVLSGLSSSQFRNYFGELRDIERQVEAKRMDWPSVRLRLHLLKARLAYGRRKNGGKVSKEFYDLFDWLLNIAETSYQSFEEALLYIEAILAYFYPLEELFDKIKKNKQILDKEKEFKKRAREEYMRGAK
mgnify:CR=1 FL=1